METQPSPTAAQDRPTTPSFRIVTLAPNLTETVFVLGFGNQIVGDTDFCKYPPEAANRPHVGGLYDVNVERILTLHPTLVFYLPHSRDVAARLDQAGIRTVMVPSETVNDVFSGIRLIGKTLGAEARAAALVESLQKQIREISDRVASLPRRRVLLAVDHEPGSIRGLYAAGSGNYLDELLRVAGGDNILRATATTYPKISPEILLKDPPDVIIDSKYAESGLVGTDWEAAMRRAWEGLFESSSKKPRIEFLTEPRVMIPGPSIAFSLRILARCVHGSDFR